MPRLVTPKLLGALAVCLLAAQSSFGQFFFVGPAGGDFFDAGNWNDQADGLGSFLATPVVDAGTGDIEHAFVVDGDMVNAAADVDFGMGSLLLDTGSALTLSGSEITFGTGSSFTMSGSSLTVDGGSTGQVEFNSGSLVSLSDASVLATDDIFFRGEVSIADSTIESTGDDIEFQSDSIITSITDSDFLASSVGTGGGFNQVIYIRSSTDQIFDSTFRGGRFGVLTDGAGTTTDVKMTDSSILVDGDIDNIFSSSNGGVHRLTLDGASTLVADQLETVALFLDGTSTATFTDDLADDDGDSWLTDNSLVRLDSTGASVTFDFDQTTDVQSRVFDGINLTTYALSPDNFTPSDWDGSSAATLRLVPEPSTLAFMASVLTLAVGSRRRS